MLLAGGLAACAGTGRGGGTNAPAMRTSVMLISRTSPTLTLLSEGTLAPSPPNANAVVNKVIEPNGMTAFLATLEEEGMFQDALTAEWSTKTADEAYEVLKQPDVKVTNQRDKDVQLPKLRALNEFAKRAVASR